MRNLIFIFTALLLGTASTMAATVEDKVAMRNAYKYNNSFIFVENGVTFSVYPDGEFDFYIDNSVNIGANVNFGSTNVTFNSGYDYNPYVQYDDYGAVIQVQNVPVIYDYYGRVNQIGGVNVWYRNGRVRRVGGMSVYYNNRGYYSHYTGYVNVYNQYYTYNPYYSYFVRPAAGYCLVYNNPYRRYYNPVRYTYYRPYQYNHRRAYASAGHHYDHHKNYNGRSKVYRNDKRVVARENNSRRGDSYKTGNSVRNTTTVAQRGNGTDTKRTINGSALNRSNRTVVNSTKRTPTNTGRSIESTAVRNGTKRSTPSASGRTVTKKKVAVTPRSKTVQRNNSNYKRPERSATKSRTVSTKTVTKRSVASKPSGRNSGSTTTKRASTSDKTVNRSPSRSSGKSNNTRSRSTKL